MLQHVLLVALGGAIGAVLRVFIRSLAARRGRATWTATLGINGAGSIVIGIVAARLVPWPEWRLVLVPGVLGGFTTFSGFALDAIVALDEGHWRRVGALIVGTMVACPIACVLMMVWWAP